MVVTSLAAQLKQLETPQTSLLIHRTKKASFLFTEKEAATFDRDTIYELGISGLRELKKLDDKFAKFEKSLFDVSSISFERTVHSSDVNEKLSSNIKELLLLLSPYFLIKPTHKVLEWLINRFHIHQFNIDELLMLGFPYHETMTFARLLQLIPLSEDKGKWNWLAPVKKSGVPLSKTALLNRATSDTAFLKFVCDLPVEASKVYGERGGALSTLYGFYCSSVVGGLDKAKQVTDLHVSMILPSIMSALSSQHVDFTASSLIILARLSTKTELSNKLVSTLYNKISKIKGEKLKKEIALMLIVLNQTNQSCTISNETLLRLASSNHLLNSVSYWSSQEIIVIPFILNILTCSLKIIQNSQTEPPHAQICKVFIEKILDLPFDDSEATAIFKVLLDEWKGIDQNWYKDIFDKIQFSFPRAFDCASTKAFSYPPHAKVLRDLLGLKSSKNSVFDSLIHPNPKIRLEAINSITKHYSSEKVGWLCDTVIARLEDDCPEVVQAALDCVPALSSADKSVLCSSLLKAVIQSWSNPLHDINLEKACSTFIEYSSDNDKILVDLVLYPVITTNISLIKGEMIKSFKSPLFNFLNENYSDGLDEDIFWSLLEENVLPVYSEASSYFAELSEIHPVYRFISLLCLAKEPSAFNSSLLSSYLDSEMTVVSDAYDLCDGKSLKKCMNICRKGSLPLRPALLYITRSLVVSCDTGKTVDQDPTSCPDVTSSLYQPLMCVLKILMDGCDRKNRKIKEVFKQATKKLLKENFPNSLSRVYFLLSCALYYMHNNDNMTFSCIKQVYSILARTKDPSTNIEEEKFSIGKKSKRNKKSDKNKGTSNDSRIDPEFTYNNGGKNKGEHFQDEEVCSPSSFLSLSSPVVPVLAAILHSSKGDLREKVLKIFVILVEAFSPIPGYRAFVEQIISNSEELKLDPEQIVLLCYTQLSPGKDIRSLLPSDLKLPMKNILTAMVSLITADSTPVYIIANILEILECVNSKEILFQLLPLLKMYIGKSKTLNNYESKIVKLILKKFGDSQKDNFTNDDVWTTLDLIVSDFSTTMEVSDNEAASPSAYLMNLLSPSLFDNLPEPKMENKKKMLSLIITNTYECENVEVTDSVSSFFKEVNIDGEIIASFLSIWFIKTTSPVKVTPDTKKIRKSVNNLPSLAVLETPEWKKGVFLLEQIQSKDQFSDGTILIPALFDVLKKCLLFEHQAPVEYTKQLLLSVLLQCCQSVGASPISPDLIQVDLIVQCLRISQNPQTHHHALLTLTIIANILPDNVLHSIMDIFTFIGTSIARQDDAYSFQIITKLIETIVPILVQGKNNEVIGVIRVFVGAMLDIPEHRRLVLLNKLILTLGPTQNLWLFLALVFENQVLKSSFVQVKSNDGDKNATPKKLEVAAQVCSEFDVSVLLETCAQLLVLANALPHDKDERLINELPKDITEIFDVKTNSGKQLRHFKFTLLGFLSYLLSSNTFIMQIAGMSDEECSELEDQLKQVMELCLSYVKELTRHQDMLNSQQFDQPISKYWKFMINQAYDVLDKVVGVLPISSFVSVVCLLLEDDACCVRKVVELVTWRLGQGRPAPPSLLKPLLQPVCNICFSEKTDVLSKQTALISLKLLTRQLAPSCIQEFTQVLQKLTDILCSETSLSWEVTGSFILCLGELVLSLGAHSISQLARFMPSLLRIMKDNSNSGELFLLSCVTCLHKIVDALSNFLSPYMKKIIYVVSINTALLQPSEVLDKATPIMLKLKSIRSKIASSVQSRVLIPAVSECYSKMLKRDELTAVGPLMGLLSESFSAGAKTSPELSSLFLHGLAFRSEATDLSKVDLVEPHVLSALTALVLKLSESSFRPLYHKVYDWAIRGSNDPRRAVTFYRWSCDLAEKLKGLFILFAGLLVPNCAALLKKCNSSKEELHSTTEQENVLLVESIIRTLSSVFTHDSHNFLTKERFDLLMQPLVDQLENELGGEECQAIRNKNILTPCLANMAGATGDDSLWKQINYQILLKMRHPSSQVKLAALDTVHLIVKKLKQDFLPLLPETVPFLAELLEDSDESIEKQTHTAISSMEAVLGEPIQKYF